MQAAAPAFVIKRSKSKSSSKIPVSAKDLGWWNIYLLFPLVGIIIGIKTGLDPSLVLIVGLVVFALIFAINSALHSYLVIAYAEEDKIALSVGFYYMSNAAGRLLGTLISGALFEWAGLGPVGLSACIVGCVAVNYNR